LAAERHQVARVVDREQLLDGVRRALDRGARGVEVEGDNLFRAGKKSSCASNCHLRAADNCSGRELMDFPCRSFLTRCNIV
jgi:hypothetical protein